MSAQLDANLAALHLSSPELAARLRHALPSAELRVLTARNGQMVPTIEREGLSRALHSLVDPGREGRRLIAALASGSGGGRLPLAAQQPPAQLGLVVAEGLGAGYQLLPLLESGMVERVLIIDCDVALVRALFEHFDFTRLIGDSRVELAVDEPPARIRERVVSTYLPGLFGALQTIPLRARVELAESYFSRAHDAVRQAVRDVSDDFAVQAAFGARWFSNIVSNLALLPSPGRELTRSDELIVTGAGPSIDFEADVLLRLSRSMPIVSADTSLPPLRARGIEPDYVLTIDCQQVGYQHYIPGVHPSTTVVLDLAAPPTIARSVGRRLFVTSGHPFGSYLAKRLSGLPAVDGSGGNVGYAAVSFAQLLGARRVHLFGIDLSYPRGAAYARGTYLSAHFAVRQSRLRSLEGEHVGLFLGDPSLKGDPSPGFVRYTTDRLSGYKHRLETALLPAIPEVVQHVGEGLRLENALGSVGARGGYETPQPPLLLPSLQAEDIERELSLYVEKLARLRAPLSAAGSAVEYLAELDPEARDAFATLLPLVSRLRSLRAELGWKAAVIEAISLADQLLGRFPPSMR